MEKEAAHVTEGSAGGTVRRIENKKGVIMGNKKGSFVGLLPLIIFVILYIISTILTGNASTMPLNTGILIAIICAFVFCAMRKKDENTMSFDDLVTSFCKGGGDDTLI